ncbi:MAG: DUF839 domain-containing protein [Candidatus Rokubacteria bacterium]|nr:DUF839 domain-containing protein [Candidatus Rokubacteria bacterium]
MNRRAFLRFLGAGALSARAPRGAAGAAVSVFDTFTPIRPSREDTLVVPPGFRWNPVMLWGDPVRGDDRFGYNADFTAFLPLPAETEGLLWVNHEFVSLKIPSSGNAGTWAQTFPLLMGRAPTVDDMRHDVGASVLHVRQHGGRWQVVDGSRYNRRITAGATERVTADGPAVADVFERHDVDGLRAVIQGTHSNCGGGRTPWGTVLSCEENFHFWVPEPVDEAGRGTVGGRFRALGSKYGWVMEADPYTPGSAPVKHTALGRFRHENVGLRARDGGRVACYMGEDRAAGHVWKFVSRERYRAGDAHRTGNRRLLESGTLFVARFSRDGTGRWIPLGSDTPLAPNGGPAPAPPAGATTLGQVYASHGAILVDAFRAANLAGGTPTGRPEDLEVHPWTGAVYIAFTGFVSLSDALFSTRLGEIWRIDEDGGDAEAPTFRWSRFIASGGVPGQGGFAQPDNLAFDAGGNLWVCSDMSAGALNNEAMPEGAYGNNGLFVISTDSGRRDAGRPRQFASAPCEAELAGPSFGPGERTIFISVQNPGERFGVRGIGGVTAPRGSNFPSGSPGAPPRPGVVAITPA